MNTRSTRKLLLSAITMVVGLAYSHAASAVTDYGGKYKCSDDAVKGQVIRALSAASVPSQANAIQAAPGKLELGKATVELTVGEATSIVSVPGAPIHGSELTIKSSNGGGPVDVLMCQYRRPLTTTWATIGAADLKPGGHLAKRMEGKAGRLKKGFASSDLLGESSDVVVVLVAAVVEKGKTTKFEVALNDHERKRKRPDPAPATPAPAPVVADGSTAAARVLKDAADAKWKQYKYGEEVLFPEAKDKVWGYDDKDFDCSYYVWLVYNHAGIDYTFTGTEGLAQELNGGEFIEVTTPKPGDLVLWRPEFSGGSIHHVGIVADDTTKFWDNSAGNNVGLSDTAWNSYKVPRKYLRRKGF